MLTPVDQSHIDRLDGSISKAKELVSGWQRERRRMLNRAYQKKHKVSKKVLDGTQEKA